MEEVDLLVVGSGSGLDVASVAASQGQSVAVVERGPLGGTCLNRGCIPSKLLLYHADVLETIERADEFHIDVTVDDVDFAGMVREVNEDVQESADSIRRGLESSEQHTLYEGEARFVDDHEVEVVGGRDDGAAVRADTVLIAAGTRPAIPSMDGIDAVDYLTSTEALQLESPPDHLVVVGGGYIAAELGHFFGAFGSYVTVISRRPTLLPYADREVADAFTDRVADRFDLYTGFEATAVSESGGGVTVEAMAYEYGDGAGPVAGGETISVTGDELLVAAGRRPNTDTLNLDATSVRTDAEGFVETDEYLRTEAEGVWALGDIAGEFLLKHAANYEAEVVARNLFGPELEPADYSAMPFAVFGSPEVAGVGAREQDLQAAGEEYATNTYRYEDIARGDAMHAEGFVKVIIDHDGGILGCHIVGPDASTLIQEVVVGMKAGSGSVWAIRESVHVHPALPEVVQRAFSGQFSSPGHEHHHHHHHE